MANRFANTEGLSGHNEVVLKGNWYQRDKPSKSIYKPPPNQLRLPQNVWFVSIGKLPLATNRQAKSSQRILHGNGQNIGFHKKIYKIFFSKNLIINLEAYRSGHNEVVLKTIWVQAHGGSNPSASAIQLSRVYYRYDWVENLTRRIRQKQVLSIKSQQYKIRCSIYTFGTFLLHS